MRLLSEEFVAHPAHRRLPRLEDGFDGQIRWVVDGMPDGKVRVIQRFDDGHVTDLELRNDASSEVTLTIVCDDLLAVLAGEIDLNALFMAGDLKTDGPTGPLFALIRAVRSDQGRTVLAELDEALDEA